MRTYKMGKETCGFSAKLCFVILCSVASPIPAEGLGRFFQTKCTSRSVTGNLT